MLLSLIPTEQALCHPEARAHMTHSAILLRKMSCGRAPAGPHCHKATAIDGQLTHMKHREAGTLMECGPPPSQDERIMGQNDGTINGREILRHRLSFPLHGLRISRSREEGASPVHPGERNCTSLPSKLSKTSSVSAPHPWLVAISRERIAVLRDTNRVSASPESRRLHRPSTSA